MFTGLIEDIGVVSKCVRTGDRLDLAIRPGRMPLDELALGESIAIDGVCLTVTEIADGSFAAVAGAETMARTTLDELTASARVNLERAMKLGDRLGGHLVQGHVDGVGVIVGHQTRDANLVITLEPPADLLRYLVAKGSVALDGISLTINSVGEKTFEIALIPHSQQETTLASKPVGARLNIEVDMIAKYVERLTVFKVAADAKSH